MTELHNRVEVTHTGPSPTWSRQRPRQTSRRAKTKDRAERAVLTVLLAVTAFLFLLPIAWWVVAAMNDTAAMDPAATLAELWIPDPGGFWTNLAEAFDLYPMGRFFFNSIAVAAVVAVCEVGLSALGGYAFAKMSFPGRNAIFTTIIALLLVPQIVIVVPLFALGAATGTLNTYIALIVPFIVTPFGIFMMRQFMSDVPDAYIEAARLDGASEFRIFLSVVLPTARNACLTLGIFTFVLQWDSLLWPLIATSDQTYFTLPVGVALLQTNVQVPYNAIYAVTLLFSLPILIAYVFMQRLFMRSMAMAGLKG